MPRVLHDEYERYQIMLVQPGNMDKVAADYAAEIGVGLSTIYSWNRRLDWKNINEQRRTAYAQVVHTIDSALLRKCQKGDTEAIKLFYARFDGYVPVSGTVDLSDKKDDELKKRADEIKARLLGHRVEPDSNGTGEARA